MSWSKRVRLVLLVVLTTVLQVSLFPDLRVFGIAPDVGLVTTAAVAFREGPERGAVYGFASGLLIDVFLQTPLGLSALAFALVGYGVGVVQTGLSRSSRWAPQLFGGIGGLAGGLVFVVIGSLAGQDHLIAWRSLWVVALAALYDAALATVVFPVARWATPHEEGVMASGRIA